MNITTDSDQEVWHDMREPGAYEWWYFDAEDTTTGVSVVLIWFAGFPFSPYYTNHYEKWKKKIISAPPLPSNYSAFSFQLYENGDEVVNFIREGEHELFESTRSEIGIRFEKNSFTFNAECDEYTLDIDFSYPARHKKVKANLSFKSTRRIRYEKKDTNNDGNVPLHQWLLSVPKADVEGLIEVTELQKGGVRKIPFRAKGYHDHNLGAVPMQEYISRWYWGRAFSKKFDIVYYVVFFKNNEYKPLTLLLLQNNESDQVTVHDSMRFHENHFRYGLFAPLHSQTLTLLDKKIGIEVRHHKVLDTGPFYLRFASDIVLTRDGQNIETIKGISEFLDPSRLQSRMMRLFTCCRVCRDGVPSIMYKSYNRLKGSFDWKN